MNSLVRGMSSRLTLTISKKANVSPSLEKNDGIGIIYLGWANNPNRPRIMKKIAFVHDDIPLIKLFYRRTPCHPSPADKTGRRAAFLRNPFAICTCLTAFNVNFATSNAGEIEFNSTELISNVTEYCQNLFSLFICRGRFSGGIVGTGGSGVTGCETAIARTKWRLLSGFLFDPSQQIEE